MQAYLLSFRSIILRKKDELQGRNRKFIVLNEEK